MDLNVGFGKVLRVRWLKAAPERKHIFAPKVETLSEKQVRHTKALDLLERRKAMRAAGEDTALIEKEVARLGFAWQDEPSRTDFAYSYWRRK